LRHELVKVKEKHGHRLGKDWPGEQEIQKLLQKADRLFIYAATICRFISKSRYPETRFSEILRASSAGQSSTKELDKMYRQILTYSITEAYEADKEDMVRLFNQIVGSIITLIDTLSTTALTRLLAVSPGQMEGTLDSLHSVLDVPQDETSPIKLFHLSFRDFLVDKIRCPDPQFWINEKTAHENLFLRCLKLMSEHLRRDMCDLQLAGALAADVEKSKSEEHIPLELQYACRYWIGHLQKSNIEIYDNGQVHKFLKEHFLHWFEALSLIGNVFDGVIMLGTLESILIVSNSIKPRHGLTS
jgi:hypothetical protein